MSEKYPDMSDISLSIIKTYIKFELGKTTGVVVFCRQQSNNIKDEKVFYENQFYSQCVASDNEHYRLL